MEPCFVPTQPRPRLVPGALLLAPSNVDLHLLAPRPPTVGPNFAGGGHSEYLRAAHGIVAALVTCSYYQRGNRDNRDRGRSSYGGGRQFRSQEEMREAKRNREAQQYFVYQKRLLRTGSHQPGEEFWRREERLLFKSEHVTQGINFEKYDDIPVERKGGRGNEQPCNSFEDVIEEYNIPEGLQNSIRKCSYLNPTPVQKHSIPAGLVGTDVMVSAQTGSGKTAAFLIPLISVVMQAGRTQLEEGPAYPSGIILAPTRELCQQIAQEAKKLCFRTDVRVCAIYGGAEAVPQLKQLAGGCEIAICTPGRLEDFLGRGVISVARTRYLVLDEADRMLDMGFEPQIRSIIEQHGMPEPGQPEEGGRVSMMFSATFPREIQDIALDFLDPAYLWIGVGRVGATTANVEHRFVDVSAADDEVKFEELIAAINEVKDEDGKLGRTMVFANTKRGVDEITWRLADARIRATQCHGGLSQASRDRALADIRSGRCRVLVATEVAARGLDLPGIDHVINYELPENSDDFVHRCGRTGRIGNTGIATSFVGEFEPAVRDIVKCIQEGDGVQQDLPDWLLSQAHIAGGKGGGRRRGKGGGRGYKGGGRGYKGGGKGWQDGGKGGGKGRRDSRDFDFDPFSTPRRDTKGGGRGRW